MLFELQKLGDPEITGDFSSMLDRAKDKAFEENGLVILHKPFDMDHFEGESCPCIPLIVDPCTLTKDNDLLLELIKLDG